MPQAISWIKPTDFIETTFELKLKNVTTSGSDEIKTGVEVIELLPSGLVLKIPKRSAALGHLVILTIIRKKAPEKVAKAAPMEFRVTAKLTSAEEFQKDSMIVTVQFYQYNETDWQALLEECSERQRKSNAVVKRIQE